MGAVAMQRGDCPAACSAGTDASGYTPLMLAVLGQQPLVVETLLESSADLSAADRHGNSVGPGRVLKIALSFGRNAPPCVASNLATTRPLPPL